MDPSLKNINSFFRGQFQTSPEELRNKLAAIKAYVFDWDGVFNDGAKNENGSSPYSEIDSMGTNLLRFNHYLITGKVPVFSILSGEKNRSCFTLANREHFDTVYFGVKHKAAAIEHLCERYDLRPSEIAFVFDDVLDLSAALLVGVRIMVPHPSTSMLIDYAVSQHMVDYTCFSGGKEGAVRECTELMMALRGRYNETIEQRVASSETYQQYLTLRQAIITSFLTVDASLFVEQTDL